MERFAEGGGVTREVRGTVRMKGKREKYFDRKGRKGMWVKEEGERKKYFNMKGKKGREGKKKGRK